MERSGEVTVLGRHAVGADLRDTSVSVKRGHPSALLRGGEAVQPAGAVDPARDDEAFDAELIDSTSDQR